MAVLATLGPIGSAQAGLHKEFSQFSDCPINNPAVATCVVSTTTSGEFTIGKKTVPVSAPVILQGGLTETSHNLVPAADGNTLSKTPLPVPGGLIGIEILGPLTSVTATAELAGTVELNVSNANTGKGVGAVLPLKVKLDNPLLLNSCYIGSDSEPLTPMLTSGTTKPPPPNTPISGSPGTISTHGHGKILIVNGSSLVDNAFSVPGANGCAGPLALVVDPAVDLEVGLPAPAGQNTAILNGTLAAAGARSVKADAALPQLGRCQKVERVKEGKTIRYSGGYVDSACIEESLGHTGKFEWVPGPGTGKKFSGTTGAVTLETVGKAKIKCVASHTRGEYTGPKAATLGITLTECKNAKAEACQSAGASAGEVVTNGLAAQLGFIKDTEQGNEFLLSVGWDLTGGSTLIAAECGASKAPLEVSGSVIAPVSTVNKMAAGYTLKYTQAAGKQNPEQFEEEPKDTLTARIGTGSSEQAGLATTNKITDEERLEIKAEVEE